VILVIIENFILKVRNKRQDKNKHEEKDKETKREEEEIE
jgi:hypothetical protein